MYICDVRNFSRELGQILSGKLLVFVVVRVIMGCLEGSFGVGGVFEKKFGTEFECLEGFWGIPGWFKLKL